MKLALLRNIKFWSVWFVDAERSLSSLVTKSLRDHGHLREAEFVEVLAQWHEASDGRGLYQLQRCRYNYKMMNMILD